jgi:chemotaxis protein CheD
MLDKTVDTNTFPGGNPRSVPTATMVGVGCLHVTRNTEEVLTSYALGSCIAVVIHDPVLLIGGLAHIQLPSAAGRHGRPPEDRWAFADLALPELLGRAMGMGAVKRRLRVVLAGGATVMDPQNFFQIGRKNYLAAKRLLWQEGIIVAAEAVGGEGWRTVRLEVGTGRITVRTAQGIKELPA